MTWSRMAGTRPRMTRRAAGRALLGAAGALLAPRARAAAIDLAGELQVLSGKVVSTGVTGCVLGIGVRARAPVIAANGLRDVATNAPFVFDTAWHVASVTKMFTATVALQLAQEGKLPLDAPIARWLPDAPAADRIEMRHLLDHGSGLADYANEAFLAAKPADGVAFTPEELMGFRDPKDLLFAPGSKAQYSNTGYLVAGRVIEAIEGRPLADSFRVRIVEPLKLEGASFPGMAPLPPERVAHGYADTDGNGSLNDTLGLPWTAGWADNALVADAPSLLTFTKALFNAELLDAQHVTLMQVPVLERDEVGQPVAAYGLGVEVEAFEGLTWAGHSGSTFGYLTTLWHQPENDVTVVAGLNAYPEDKELLDKITRRLMRLAMKAAA